ncbi:phage baseplate protein [Streptomyces sp. NPDC054765]
MQGQHPGQGQRPGRRTVFRLGVVAAAAAVAPVRWAGAASAPGRKPPALSAAGRQFLAGKLRHTTVLQSFAVDERRGHVYALQLVAGGFRLPGEKAALSHAERAGNGDLCLNRLTLDGSEAGHMYLKGFGHGGSIGLEEAPGGVRLWTEWDANPSSGYGRGVCRFRFADGQVRGRDSGELSTYHPVTGSTSNCPALDLSHRHLLVRYKRAGIPRFALYDLDRFRSRWFWPLTDFLQPGAGLGLPFQGMALYGNYAYQILGSAYGAGNPASSGGNTRLYRMDLRTGRVVWQQLERTAPGLSPREPEGLAVLSGDGTPRLCLGFVEGPAGGRSFRLYDKALS